MEDGIICFGCDASEKQVNSVQKVADDTVFNADFVITSTQLPNTNNSKEGDRKQKLQTHCISTQTEGSFVDLQKKDKRYEHKRKAFDK